MEKRNRSDNGEVGKKAKVFRAREEFGSYPLLPTIAALGIWLGLIHFNVALVLFSLFFLSLSKALLVFALLIVFIVIPINHNSNFGRKLSRYVFLFVLLSLPFLYQIRPFSSFIVFIGNWISYFYMIYRFICKHACRYFPITLQVEDINAFNPDRPYGQYPVTHF